MAVLDDFNRADSNLNSGNWATPTGAAAVRVVSNQGAGPSSVTAAAAYWTAVLGNDQWARQLYEAGTDFSPAVRMATGSLAWYEFNYDAGSLGVYKTTGGSTFFQIGSSGSATPSAGQAMELQIAGSTLSAYWNPASPVAGVPTTGTPTITGSDVSFTSGKIGSVAYDTTSRWDDFDGGTLGTTTFAASLLPDFFPVRRSIWGIGEFRPVLPPAIPTLGIKVVLPESYPQPRPLRVAETRSPFIVLAPSQGVKVVLPERPHITPFLDRTYHTRSVLSAAVPNLGVKAVLPERTNIAPFVDRSYSALPVIVVPVLGTKVILPEWMPAPPVADRSYFARVHIGPSPLGFNVIVPEAAVGLRWAPMGVADAGTGMPIINGSVELPDFVPPVFSLAGLTWAVVPPAQIAPSAPLLGRVILPEMMRPVWPLARSELVRPLAFVAPPILGSVVLPALLPARFPMAGLAGHTSSPPQIAQSAPLRGSVSLPELMRPLWPLVRSELIRPLAFVAPPILGTVELPDLARPTWPFITTETFRSGFVVATAAPVRGNVTLPERYPAAWPVSRSELFRSLLTLPPVAGMMLPERWTQTWPYAAAASAINPQRAAPLLGTVVLPSGALAASQRRALIDALLQALRPIAAVIGVVGPNHTADLLSLASTTDLLSLAQTLGVYTLATTKEIT